MSTNQRIIRYESLLPETKIGFLGPKGTFAEQALLSEADLAATQVRPYDSIPDVLNALVTEEVDLGFVPIENAIEGAVNVTQDSIAFDLDLKIHREVVLDVQLDLLALPGTKIVDIQTVLSFPVAIAQCRAFLREHLPAAKVIAATSTAEAARQVGEQHMKGVATISNSRAGAIYGLDVIEEAIDDHVGNQTRFLLLGRNGIPAPSGNDKSSVVVFQQANQPGSLLAILHEFAARNIDITRLESRPTRRELGDYCFLLDFEGHISDEVVADCLRELKMKQGNVKFLGSYPAYGSAGSQTVRDANANWSQAQEWIESLRDQME